MSGSMPGVLIFLSELHQRRGQWGQQYVQVTPNCSYYAAANESRGVLQGPYELVRHLHDADRNRGCLASFRHQEDRNFLIASADKLDEVQRTCVVVILTEGPIYKD